MHSRKIPSNKTTLTYPGVYLRTVQPLFTQIPTLATNITCFVGHTRKGSSFKPTLLRSFREYEKTFGRLHPNYDLGYAVKIFFNNKGRELWVTKIPARPTSSHWNQCYKSLDRIDNLCLLALPGISPLSVLKKAIHYCEKRDGFLIMDPPKRYTKPSQLTNYLRSTNYPISASSALYYPYLVAKDPLSAHKTRLVPPSGAIAGIYAYTDSTRGVWKAPAGLQANVYTQGLSYQCSDNEQRMLNPKGVNVIRQFAQHGIVVWGSRTRQSAKRGFRTTDYVPVQRLLTHLKKSLEQGLEWVTFEQNNQPHLWSRIKTLVEEYLSNLYRQGAFSGSKMSHAYFVKCGLGETMTQNDITQGKVIVTIGFAPLKPAEFVILHIIKKLGN